MSFTFRPATRESIWLLLGLSGASGAGKTFSAMRLAKGLSGDKPFALIDTEAGRAKHYAEAFKFDHGDLGPPFSPERYLEAILAAEQASYSVIVVDSMSHEWAGDGGVLDMRENELDRMAGTDPARRESCKVASWIKPKLAHKKMMARLLQLRAHLILCFRAEGKIEMIKEGGKMVVRPKASLTGLDGWIPICEKSLPFELTTNFMLSPEHPGIPRPIRLEEDHKRFFPLDSPITEESGRRLGEWAMGGTGKQLVTEKNKSEAEIVTDSNGDEFNGITPKQAATLASRFLESLREDLRGNHAELLRDFLTNEGYTDGNAMLIPKLYFAEVGKAAVAHAKQL